LFGWNLLKWGEESAYDCSFGWFFCGLFFELSADIGWLWQFVVDNGQNLQWVVFEVFNFEEGMIVSGDCFTFLAKAVLILLTDYALEEDSDYGTCLTLGAALVLMNHFMGFLSFRVKIVFLHSLFDGVPHLRFRNGLPKVGESIDDQLLGLFIPVELLAVCGLCIFSYEFEMYLLVRGCVLIAVTFNGLLVVIGCTRWELVG
jgi:hypothetical protein